MSFLASISITLSWTDGFWIPHSWCWVLLVTFELRLSLIARIFYVSSAERRNSCGGKVRLPKTVCELSHYAFIYVLRYKTTAVSDYIGVPACPITKVLKSCRFFASSQFFELVILVDEQGRRILCGLVPRPRRLHNWGHVVDTHKSSIACQDVVVSTHAIPPVGSVLDMLSTTQRSFHSFDCK